MLRRLRCKLCLLLGIWVLNLSVDAPDLLERLHGVGIQPVHSTPHLNEVESVGEWLVEHLMGLEHAVPEGDEATDAPDDHRPLEPAPLADRLSLATSRSATSTARCCVHAQPSGCPQALEPPPPRTRS